MTTWTQPKLERLDVATLTQTFGHDNSRGHGRDDRDDRRGRSWGHDNKKSCSRDDS